MALRSASKALALAVVACLAGGGCSATASPPVPTAHESATSHSTPATTSTARSACLVGATWSNWAEVEKYDEPTVEAAILDAGGKFESLDGRSSPGIQAAQVDAFVAEGARVILVMPAADDDVSLRAAVDRAIASGIAVIAYGRVIESPNVLFVAFDEVEAGRVEARALLAAKPKGNYVIVRFVEGTYWDVSHSAGVHEVLQPAIDRGDIRILAEIDAGFWDWDLAGSKLAAVLAQNHNNVDAITYDWHWPQGIQTTLQQANLDDKVAVATQGDFDWNLRDVALGTETVGVWRDGRLTGKAAGEAAVALCKNLDVSRLAGTKPFSSPGHNQIPAILFAPQAITKDNLKLVLDSGWADQAYVCASIEPGMTSACP